jgi:hypothetical protein
VSIKSRKINMAKMRLSGRSFTNPTAYRQYLRTSQCARDRKLTGIVEPPPKPMTPMQKMAHQLMIALGEDYDERNG